MDIIDINGIGWSIVRVPPNSGFLVDRENVLTLGTTDPITRTIYISNRLRSPLKERVIAHELGHAACFSYDLMDEIHRFAKPKHWIDAEEFICNFVANYGKEIWNITEDLSTVKSNIERLIR